MSEHALTPSSYIEHHLAFNAKDVGGGFWTLHMDTLVVSWLLGIFAFGFLWWVVRGATAGVPNKRLAFVELLVEFVDDQVKGIFHGDRNAFVAPAALTVFVWVLMMNAMDFLPVDIMAWIYHNVFGQDHFRAVPTSDINSTFALALAVWVLMIFFSIKVKGLGGWIHELFCAPFGSNVLVWPANFLFNLIEYVSKPLSHSLRLFGNMYAGEIIFLLLGMWAATGLAGTIFGALLGAGWAIFHILIVVLQAFIFMMLTVVYIAMAHESH
ncbi:ATP synthase subunit a [Ferriphaselus amnicola]|jgi:F-type H+-transporting ATPase subunit a|uniref:ATP synthase subunit a n=1 Tax=Ferriphaselus amnicola TaxID=1188319 RepID=A0A2Z6GFH7_9PROT|nr:F0F1 ATP synthase subunit A [Ferriphaselus amnicola]BBE52152.1 ATP synthase subunit a [Ferriphaselus amnicola]